MENIRKTSCLKFTAFCGNFFFIVTYCKWVKKNFFGSLFQMGVKHYFSGIDFWKFCQSSTKNFKNETTSSCKNVFSIIVKPTQNFKVGQEE